MNVGVKWVGRWNEDKFELIITPGNNFFSSACEAKVLGENKGINYFRNQLEHDDDKEEEEGQPKINCLIW